MRSGVGGMAGWPAGGLAGWLAGWLAGRQAAWHLRLLYVFQMDVGAFALIIRVPNGRGAFALIIRVPK